MEKAREVIRKRREQQRRVIREAAAWANSLPYPATVVLIGSYARGDFNQWSDIDILVVSPVFRGKNPLERLLEIDAPPGYEIIPWTPEEFKNQLEKNNPTALEAARHGIMLRDDLEIMGKAGAYRRSPHEVTMRS